MGLLANFDISGSAISAQLIRLNTTASNMANSETVASSAEEAYRARHPVFQAMMKDQNTPSEVGVRMLGIVENPADIMRRYDPGHAMATTRTPRMRSTCSRVNASRSRTRRAAFG